MTVFQMVAIIVVAGIAAGVIKELIKQKSQQKAYAGDVDERLKRLEDLEERVKVLEKIVTDKTMT